MKKIVTAIGNPNLNKKLKLEEGFTVVAEDIQYKEGILEILEKEEDIDFLILSSILPGNIEIKKLIEKIKEINSEINIILFLENKNEELENYFYAKGINYIFYNNEIEINEIIELIKNNQKNPNAELKKEINELKKMLLEQEKKNNLIYMQKQNKKIKRKNIEKEINDNEIIEKEKQIICISGTSGIGKSIFSVNFAKSFLETKKKILMIDFDILNDSLHTILGINKYPEKIKKIMQKNNNKKIEELEKIEEIKNIKDEIKIEELIIKVNSKIDLIAGINLLFESKYKISNEKIKIILEKLKENYDMIIIDTSSECFFDCTKEIMKLSNLIIFITGANLIEIKKAKRLLNIYINEWKIEKNNFNILFNKYNKNSIDISILKNIFSGFNILGKMSDNEKYNLMINKSSKEKLEKEIQKEFYLLHKKMIK